MIPVSAIGLVAVLGGQLTKAAALFPDALPPNPYFVPEHAFLLYLLTPLLLLSAVALLVMPGVLLVRRFGSSRVVAPLLLKGALVSFVLIAGSFGVLKALAAEPSAGLHAGLLYGLNLAAWLAFALSPERALATPGEALRAGPARRWVWAAAIPVLTAILLLPVLFWQDLNPDGLEALTGGRSLAWFALPRLPTGEVPGLNLGMIASSYPVHWFIVLFGLNDAAGRLPLLLYAPLIWMGALALIEVRSPRRLTAGEEAGLAAGITVFIAAIAYNDTYHAYSADIASPANIDFLAMAGMLAMLYFFWNEEWGWFLFAALFTHLTRPTGLLLLGLLGAALVLADREGIRHRLGLIAAAILLLVAWTAGFERLLPRLIDLSIVSGADEAAGRLRYLRFDHLERLLWVVIPAGIVPVLALPALRQQDRIGRALTAMTVLYFLFFYVIAFTALHHFAPAMLLPIVVFWRTALKWPATGRRVAVTVAAAGLALWLSLPQTMEPDRTMRPIGRATVWNVGSYAGDYDEYRLAFAHKDLLEALFRPLWEVADPASELIASPWLQIRYGGHGDIGPDANYVAQPVTAPAPAGFTRVAADSAAALWVRDLDRWDADRHRRRSTEWQSPLLRVERETLFSMIGVEAGAYDVDVGGVLERLRGR